jgi:hypothetical protein
MADGVVPFALQAKFEEMLTFLPEAEPCFVVFDFHEAAVDGRIIKKLALIKWCVGCASILILMWRARFLSVPSLLLAIVVTCCCDLLC